MTTYRRYHFTCPATDARMAQRYLEGACAKVKWFTDPYVETKNPGLGFGFTVAARDQWWCHVRAMRLGSEVYEVLGLSPRSLSTPLWTALDPHSNRGYAPYRYPSESPGRT